MMSARALATPVAIGPMKGTAGILTETFACGLAVFNSAITCARSSIEYMSWLLDGESRSMPRRVARPGDQLCDFHSGQVPAFTRFRALADLDLYEVGAVEQMNVDAETAR